MLLKSTIIILGLYFLVCILMYINQRNFIYFPGINNSIKYDKINKLNSNEKIISQNDKKIIKNEVINMENIDLKKSLINLGISITKGSK